jgi:chemotaxis response regulator CheB
MDSADSPRVPQQAQWLVTVAASAGGIPALQALVGALPRDLPAAPQPN